MNIQNFLWRTRGVQIMDEREDSPHPQYCDCRQQRFGQTETEDQEVASALKDHLRVAQRVVPERRCVSMKPRNIELQSRRLREWSTYVRKSLQTHSTPALVDNAHWKSGIAASTDFEICCAKVRDYSSIKSPTTIPQTSATAFLRAVIQTTRVAELH